MSKKKDKKKSGKSKDKIELREISAEETVQTPAPPKKTSAKKTVDVDAETVEAKPGCKVKVLPALNGKTDNNYEETTAAALNATVAEGYELLCVVPSADAKKLVAFFRLSK